MERPPVRRVHGVDVTTNAFDTLRAKLRVPYREEPYHVALERAEAEAVATREAVFVWVDAVINGAGALAPETASAAYAELTYWLHQARCAKLRLDKVRERKLRSQKV